ncbi:MAG: hypothetical protein HN929_11500 [Chloroflexi bacterium]|jgi:hypothetical protein|nr:hypothetical protein [Chloroflexota bacterium]
MTKQFKCIKSTTWRGRIVRPDPTKPFIVSVETSKNGKTILDDNPFWKEIVTEKPEPELTTEPEA